jgi:hypothetical protein
MWLCWKIILCSCFDFSHTNWSSAIYQFALVTELCSCTCAFENCQSLFLSRILKFYIFPDLYILKRWMVTFTFQLLLPSSDDKQLHQSAMYTQIPNFCYMWRLVLLFHPSYISPKECGYHCVNIRTWAVLADNDFRVQNYEFGYISDVQKMAPTPHFKFKKTLMPCYF